NTKVEKGQKEVSIPVSPISLKMAQETKNSTNLEMVTEDRINNYFDLMTLVNDKYFVLGTDAFGRDVLSRLIYGARVSLEVGLLAIGFATILGIFFGLISGFFGGWIDLVIMRFTDIMMSMPDLLLVMALVSVIPTGEGESA